MTRLVLISDLHFGRDDPELMGPLRAAIQATRPDLVLMAGDFVQRARAGQFSAARTFMDTLELPWMGVPGNHDIPLYNLPLRFLDPYRAYRRWIAQDREPVMEFEETVVLGLDTTDPFAHQRGRVTPADIRRIGRAIERADGRMVVVLAHHPFHQAPDIEKRLMLGAPDALEHWAACGPHVILSGHLHRWFFEPFVDRKGARMTLHLHCGTGLSLRRRGEPNDFAILDCAGTDIAVTRMVADGAGFRTDVHKGYSAGPDGWEKRA